MPSYRAVLTGTHAMGPWRFLARLSYFDSSPIGFNGGFWYARLSVDF